MDHFVLFFFAPPLDDEAKRSIDISLFPAHGDFLLEHRYDDRGHLMLHTNGMRTVDEISDWLSGAFHGRWVKPIQIETSPDEGFALLSQRLDQFMRDGMKNILPFAKRAPG